MPMAADWACTRDIAIQKMATASGPPLETCEISRRESGSKKRPLAATYAGFNIGEDALSSNTMVYSAEQK